MQIKTKDQLELELINDIGAFTHNPLGYVRYAYPWGEGDLAGAKLENWQKEVLNYIGNQLKDGEKNGYKPIRIAVASGHGIGKSALVSFVCGWGLSTCENTKIIVTANTETQLSTKTWPELSKWHNKAINKHWFNFTATSLYSSNKENEKTWRADAIPWSINKSEAFAGAHNKKKRIIIIYDEASAIDDKIWEVTEGALTDADTEIIWIAFGNPTRNTGRFYECFNRHQKLWKTWKIDSRDVNITNKLQIQEWIDTYGIDSDFVKIRVRGEFPDTSYNQYIPQEIITAARGRKLGLHQYGFAPVILTCDPAWSGEDSLIIAKRQGLFFNILDKIPKNNNDGVIANKLANYEDQFKADAVFIDLGYGTGIYSIGEIMGRKWQLISNAEASSTVGYLNKRAECAGKVKDWLNNGGAIPDDQELCEELSWVETVPNLAGKIQLLKKEDIKKVHGRSPGCYDALALSFARPVIKKMVHNQNNIARDYDPMRINYSNQVQSQYECVGASNYDPFKGGN